jgi:uncharacterized membrane protein
MSPGNEASRVISDRKEMVKSSTPLAQQESSVNRPQNTERVVDALIAQWVVRTATRIAGTYAILAGLVILLGGPQRFAGLSYRVALETPGAPSSWGTAILASGVAIVVGSIFAKPRLIGAGALLGSIWALLFASAFGVAAFRFDEANTMQPLSYLLLFAIYGLIAGAHLAMNPIRAPWRRKGKG